VRFDQPLIPGQLLRRYKRFLADVRLENGETVTAHCPNSGSMKTCVGEGWPVMLSISDSPKRKLRHTWEMVHNGSCWIGINTHLANRVAEEAVANDVIAELRGYEGVRREVRYGESSRIDLLLEGGDGICYVEVKNVTLVDGAGRYAFPDAVTSRGLKHLGELTAMVGRGHRAVMLYVIQRSDGGAFTAAGDIDPAYAQGLRRAVDGGIEALAYRTDVSPAGIEIAQRVPIEL